MGHAGNNLVLLIALAATIGIPFYMFRLKRNVMGSFNALLKEKRFTQRTSSPVAAFTSSKPPDGLYFSSAYDGELKPGVPMTLLLLRRSESVPVNGVMIQSGTLYVGAYLPQQTAVNANFIKTWQDKDRQSKERVAYAAPAAEGGFVIVWQGTPARKNVEAHLNALLGSLR
ncbi:MAG: hypothetical protein ABJB01_00885 [Rudaea sp.]